MDILALLGISIILAVFIKPGIDLLKGKHPLEIILFIVIGQGALFSIYGLFSWISKYLGDLKSRLGSNDVLSSGPSLPLYFWIGLAIVVVGTGILFLFKMKQCGDCTDVKEE